MAVHDIFPCANKTPLDRAALRSATNNAFNCQTHSSTRWLERILSLDVDKHKQNTVSDNLSFTRLCVYT